jgi:cobalt-zinc-cadmium efflux system outer membrane protein
MISCPNRSRRCLLKTDNQTLSSVCRRAASKTARLALCGLLILLAAAGTAQGQQGLAWEQVKSRFEASNPALKADADNVDEMRAEEITAYLRPNPQLTVAADGTQIAPGRGVWEPLAGTDVQPGVSYLHKRDHKRELRLESAQEGTRISASEHEDLKRNMEFTLRSAFVATLQAKAVLTMAQQISTITTRS